ncbi:hypothetical protein AURDEDRAFT_188026 [Auricularia subglabra TFB-10046 SS5]|uniref:F-box domain-containing protein n=1 Tax=Auricularia subglabra (strain TFB-10046 / SS5) TaxID=717982 RepID=J0D072_AURST|nr:hypothetical protein AURDEDRAFT_188026 [Auricularia subglabra TFB-10046 SS5]
MRWTIFERRSRSESSPLFKLPDDLLPGVLDLLSASDLAALSGTARCLREPCTSALYTYIRLDSYDALRMLVCTLESRPSLGLLTRSFAESTSRPFLFVEPQPEMLVRILRLMPHLRALSLASPIDVVTPDLGIVLQALVDLETLRLGDATPETIAILEHILPVRTLSLRQFSVGWSVSDAHCNYTALATYLLRTRDVLSTLEVDGMLLEPVMRAYPDAQWPNVRRLIVHECAHTTRTRVSAAFPAASSNLSECLGRYGACTSRAATWATSRIVEPKAPKSPHFFQGPLVWISLGALLGMLLRT